MKWNSFKYLLCVVSTCACWFGGLFLFYNGYITNTTAAILMVIGIFPMFRRGYYRELEMREKDPELYKLHRYFMDKNL